MTHNKNTLVGNERDIVISTRVRFARNLVDYPFPGRLNQDQEREIINKVADAMSKSYLGDRLRLIDMTTIDSTERSAMMEKHLISQEFASGTGVRSVLLSDDESISIMINEEDHLRIQIIGVGLCLDECLKQAIGVDNILGTSLAYAFDEKLGHLTKCPTNLGTGIRTSVMLHLPALTQSGAIRNLASNAGKLGFAVRGMFGEGSQARGSIYQISNQMTLGFTEEAIVERLSDALTQIITYERNNRNKFHTTNKTKLENMIWRSVGILSYARSITSEEAIKRLSDIRLGSSLGLLDISTDTLNDLLWEIQPANLTKSSGKELLTPDERDESRASLLRSVQY